MSRRIALNFSLALTLAALLAASPAAAQGKSKKHDKKEKGRVEQVRYEPVRPDLRRRDQDVRRVQKNGKSVPPGWCIGKGNPHNTPENCGYSNDRRRSDRRYDDRRYDDRRYSDGRYGRYGSYAAYARAHEDFHRSHDRHCRDRAAQRPLDPTWQLRVRAECRAEHDRWHERAGVRHDGTAIYTSRRY